MTDRRSANDGKDDGTGDGSGESTYDRPGDETLTWRQLLAGTTRTVGDRNHARWMCETASGCWGTEFADELDQRVTRRMLAHLDALIARRMAGEPLQYVLGSWQFRTLDLMVDQRVLIPRPETEWVCEAALRIARSITPRPLRIADLGTGSGAIGLSLAAELPVGSAAVWLADVSADALDVARANLAGLGRSAVSVRLVQGSWFAALPEELRGALDLVVANPPYVAEGDQALDRSVLDWEPHLALFGGSDGLRHIRTIVAGAPIWLADEGWLVLEIGATQGAAVASLLTDSGFRHVEIRKDLAHRDRIALGQRGPCGSVEAGGELAEQIVLDRVDLVIDARNGAGRREQRGPQDAAADPGID